MSGKLKSASGTQTIAGIKYESRGWRIATSTANIADINLTCPTFLWRLVVPVPTQSPAWHSERCLLPKYCINLINTSITCNPTTTDCVYTLYSATTAKFPPIRAQCGPRDVQLHQSELKPEADWFPTIISLLGTAEWELTRTLHLTLTKSNYKLQSFHKLTLKFS